LSNVIEYILRNMIERATTSDKDLRCSGSFGFFVKRKPSLVVNENVVFQLSVLT
jgi:hypothetical protein